MKINSHVFRSQISNYTLFDKYMLELFFKIFLLRFLYRMMEKCWPVIEINMGASSCVYLVTDSCHDDDEVHHHQIVKKVNLSTFS